MKFLPLYFKNILEQKKKIKNEIKQNKKEQIKKIFLKEKKKE